VAQARVKNYAGVHRHHRHREMAADLLNAACGMVAACDRLIAGDDDAEYAEAEHKALDTVYRMIHAKHAAAAAAAPPPQCRPRMRARGVKQARQRRRGSSAGSDGDSDEDDNVDDDDDDQRKSTAAAAQRHSH
jgi:hypothetical protein